MLHKYVFTVCVCVCVYVCVTPAVWPPDRFKYGGDGDEVEEGVEEGVQVVKARRRRRGWRR